MAQGIFPTKPQTKDIVQRAIVLVFNESANVKTVLYTYLRLTLNGNYVGWSYIRVLRNIQLLAVTTEAIRVSAGEITRLKSLE